MNYSDLRQDWIDVWMMSVHQVAVGDRPLLGHQSQGRQEVVIAVREGVLPLVLLASASQWHRLLLLLLLPGGGFVRLPPPLTSPSFPLLENFI